MLNTDTRVTELEDRQVNEHLSVQVVECISSLTVGQSLQLNYSAVVNVTPASVLYSQLQQTAGLLPHARMQCMSKRRRICVLR